MENLLNILDEFKDSYYHYTDLGKNNLKNKKVIFLGLCRSVSKVIEKNLNTLVDLVKDYVADYKIILFENDSDDNTLEILNSYREKNNNLIIINDTFQRPKYGPVKDYNRTKFLAEYRNILKDYAAKNYKDYDFVIVIDTDFLDFNINGFYNSFGWMSHTNQVDAICGNSLEIKQITNHQQQKQQIVWNYDSWAYRGSWWNDFHLYSPTKDSFDRMTWFGFWIPPLGSPIIRINSGFGGMAIYKTHQYFNGEYEGYDCEHVIMNLSLHQKNKDFKLFLNPSQTMLVSP